MDLYAEDLADYIYQENNVDKKRALLLEVEAEIKKLMGEQEKGSLDLRHIGAVQIEKIEDLVSTRSLILNRMFQATSQEIKRFEAVNELLNSLTKKMYHRMANLYRTLINSPKDESFDDDYVIRGTLRYVFCGVESILELPEDGYYGSDFAYMIELIYYLLEDCNGGLPEIEECSCNYSPKGIYILNYTTVLTMIKSWYKQIYENILILQTTLQKDLEIVNLQIQLFQNTFNFVSRKQLTIMYLDIGRKIFTSQERLSRETDKVCSHIYWIDGSFLNIVY